MMIDRLQPPFPPIPQEVLIEALVDVTQREESPEPHPHDSPPPRGAGMNGDPYVHMRTHQG